MVDPPLCESGDSRIVTGPTPNMVSVAQSGERRFVDPKERDRNSSDTQKSKV